MKPSLYTTESAIDMPDQRKRAVRLERLGRGGRVAGTIAGHYYGVLLFPEPFGAIGEIHGNRRSELPAVLPAEI